MLTQLIVDNDGTSCFQAWVYNQSCLLKCVYTNQSDNSIVEEC